MRKKVYLYFAFVLLFILWKPLFMCYHWDIYSQYNAGDWLKVMWYGLPHDLTCAGYICALPMLLSLVNIWILGPWHRKFMIGYIRVILVPVLLILLADLELYTHWGFRLDTTPFIYLTDNPGTALANAPTWALIVLPIILFVIWWCLQRALSTLFPPRKPGTSCRLPKTSVRLWKTLGGIVLCGLLFVAIRGGVTVSTMNVGRVYFSSEMPLNHAATNPLFSLLSSISKTEDFKEQYRFMSDEEAQAAIDELNAQPQCNPLMPDSTTTFQIAYIEPEADTLHAVLPSSDQLLNTKRPNVVIILLESFSGAACQALYPDADPQIMPNLNNCYRNGIGFTNFYANSFRTDRGLAAIMASYPGQPSFSIMKQAQKVQNLQYMSKRMGEYGYDLHFIHGGDADFTNLRGFLRSGGIDKITADVDFPIGDRLSKWGVPDHKMFTFLYDQIIEQAEAQTQANEGDEKAQPFLKVFLSLSSHEPFDVPFDRFEDLYTNSVAYTDSCMGSFIDRLRATPYWDNLLIIGLPDHCFSHYPATLQNHEPLRYHIPMFWVGGAIERPRIIDTYGSQTDLAATLLHQLNIPHEDFNFSKDMMNDSIAHYAFYAFSDGFGFLCDTCQYVQDNANDGVGLSGTNDPHGTAQRWGKAYLQKLYDDLSTR